MSDSVIPPGPRGDLGPFEALARVIAIFYAPRRVAEEIRERPNWVFPLLLSVFASFLMAAVIFSRPEWQQALLKGLAASSPKLGELEKFRMMSLMKGMAWIGALAAPVIGNVLLAVLLWGTAVMMEGKAPFLTVFSFQLHAQMVTVVPQMLLVVPLLVTRGTGPSGEGGNLPTSLAYFLPAEGVAPALRSLASAMDVFSLWYWAIVVIGLSIVARMPRSRVLVPVAILWAAGVMVKAALVSMAGPLT